MRLVDDDGANQLPRVEIVDDGAEVGAGGQLGRQVEEACDGGGGGQVCHDGLAFRGGGLRVDCGARNGFFLQ